MINACDKTDSGHKAIKQVVFGRANRNMIHSSGRVLVSHSRRRTRTHTDTHTHTDTPSSCKFPVSYPLVSNACAHINVLLIDGFLLWRVYQTRRELVVLSGARVCKQNECNLSEYIHALANMCGSRDRKCPGCAEFPL